MTAVLDQVKNVAYTGVGVNLVVTDAIIGREVPAPKAVTEHAATARAKGTEALTDLRGRTEPLAAKVVERLPEQVAGAVDTGRKAAWGFLGIDAPKAHRSEGRQEGNEEGLTPRNGPSAVLWVPLVAAGLPSWRSGCDAFRPPSLPYCWSPRATRSSTRRRRPR